MGTDDAFTELGLASDASEREVKAAWRKLVSQWHPDRNASSSAVARIQRINRAFEEIRRARLLSSDDAGSSANSAADAPAENDFSDSAHPQGPDGSADPVDDGQPRRKPIHRKVKLTLEEAAAGCIKLLRGQITDACLVCAGAGHIVLGGNCAQCQGSGAISKRAWFGWPSATTECEACNGGGLAMQSCAACAATGKCAPVAYQVNVRIPRGLRSGDVLHVDARRTRRDRPPADLEIRVEITEHAFFELDAGSGTVRCEVPVDGFAWVGNRSVQTPTLAGLQSLQLSRDKVVYRLVGQGFPLGRSDARGDLVVTVVPVFPSQLGTDREILLDQLIAASSGADGQPSDARLRSWSKGLRAWEKGLPKAAR